MIGYKRSFYFIDTQLVPRLSESQLRMLGGEGRKNAAMSIAEQVEYAAQRNSAFAGFSDRMTPFEFEAYCTEELRRVGWRAYRGKGVHDQGVDVVAEKDGLKVILQCKLYSQPVGNKAVQEAFAGRTFESAQYAAVVTNNLYTPSAQELAATNGVLLLHYTELATLDARLRRLRGIESAPLSAVPAAR